MGRNLFGKGIHFSPDEGGGAAKKGEEKGAVIKLEDGTEVTPEQAAKELAELKKTRAEYTQGQQAMSELKGQINALQAQINAQKKPEPKEEAPNFDQMHAQLDEQEAALDFADDGYEQALKEVRSKRRELTKQEREYDKAQTRRETQGLTRNSERAQAVDRANERLFTEFLSKPENLAGVDPASLTRADKEEIWKAMHFDVHPDHGTFDANLGRTTYNADAMAAAVRMVPSVREKIEAAIRAGGRDEGHKGRGPGQEADGATPDGRRMGTPPTSDNFPQVAEELRRLPPDQQGARLRTLPAEFKSWYWEQYKARA